MDYQLIMRSYAPFKSFGVPDFHGDGRGPTTSAKATARVAAWITFDPTKGTVGKPQGKSDETIMLTLPLRATAIPEVRVDSVQLGKGWMHFRLNASAANPVFKRAAPNIDLHLSFTVSLTKQHLNVNADLTGDAFPNAEVMVQDPAGTRRMIYTFETSGGRRTGPFTHLAGDRQAKMNAICVSLPVNESGAFV
jgi:hypothetical protein